MSKELKELLQRQIIALNTDNKTELEREIIRSKAIADVAKQLIEIEKVEVQKVKVLLQSGYELTEAVQTDLGVQISADKRKIKKLLNQNTNEL